MSIAIIILNFKIKPQLTFEKKTGETDLNTTRHSNISDFARESVLHLVSY